MSDESNYQPQSGGSGANALSGSGEPTYGESSSTPNTYAAQNDSIDDSSSPSNAAVSAAQGGSRLQGGNDAAFSAGSGSRDRRASAYEGYDQGDSTASGGYGANTGGDSFSRANQLGVDTQGPSTANPAVSGGIMSSKSGTSTPGYIEEDEEYSGKETQGGNGSAGLDPYGDNEPDAKENPYHEQGRR